EGERAVLVHRDLDRDHVATLGFRRGVVRLAELHDVHAVLTQRRPDRGGGVGGTGLDLELDQPSDLLLGGHRNSPQSGGPTPWAMTRLHAPELLRLLTALRSRSWRPG